MIADVYVLSCGGRLEIDKIDVDDGARDGGEMESLYI